MTREELKPKASEMLKAHQLNEVFVCSDGQGFTDKNRAVDHARYLKDKNIERFAKNEQLPVAVAKFKELVEVDDDRTELVARYNELFGKKPAHNIGVEKLKTQIAEKEAELAQDENLTVQDATQTEENPADEKEDLNND